MLKNSAFQLVLALLIPVDSNRHLRERHWQKYDRVAIRVAEVWEGFREACFAPPVPETKGDFREYCLRASKVSTFCAPTIRARVPQRPVVSNNGRNPALLPGDEPRVTFLSLLSLAKQRKVGALLRRVFAASNPGMSQ